MNRRGACCECAYSVYATQLGTEGFYCHLEPPKLVMLPPTMENPVPMLASIWPQVDENAFCGKFLQDPVSRRTKQ